MARLDYQVIATNLMGAMNKSVTGFLKVTPDKDPTIETKPLYAGDKLNISTYAEFIDGSYGAVIYLHHHARDKGTNRFCGMFILYVSSSAVNNVVKVFGFKNAQEAGDEKVSDGVAELCNNIAGVFKQGLSGVGYPELEISTPLKFRGFSGDLDYPRGEKNFYRVTAYAWGKTITMDVILSI